MENINLDNLSYRELVELEANIKEKRAKIKESYVYKIEFYLRFNPSEHENDDLSTSESFGDWLVNSSIYDDICKSFGLHLYQDISGCDVFLLEKRDYPEMFRAES